MGQEFKPHQMKNISRKDGSIQLCKQIKWLTLDAGRHGEKILNCCVFFFFCCVKLTAFKNLTNEKKKPEALTLKNLMPIFQVKRDKASKLKVTCSESFK